ncbi:MAG: hypothetical protein D6725_01895 [Planctomycetota bacterium]|nr:MAG: hypothetical protein D6725_01895 [Planctomycetota bacterium]
MRLRSIRWGLVLAALVWCVCGARGVVHGQSPQARLSGHTDPVYDVRFSPDGRWIVTGSFDNTVRLWDARTLAPVRTMSGHTKLVLCVAVSPDGRWIASGSMDRTIRLWEIPRDTPLGDLTMHAGGARSVAVAANGTVATVGADRKLRLFDGSGKPIREVALAGGVPTRVALRSDGQYAAAGDDQGFIHLVKVADGSAVRWGAQAGAVTGLRFTPNNAYLMTAGADGTLKRWSSNPPAIAVTKGGSKAVSAAVHPQGGQVAVCGGDRVIRLLNRSDGKVVRTIELPANVVALAIASNGQTIAVACADRRVRLVQFSNGAVKRELPAAAEDLVSVAIHPAGQFVAAGSSGGKVFLWKAGDGAAAGTLSGPQGPVRVIGYTPNGTYLYGAGTDKLLWVWKTADRQPLRRLTLPQAVTAAEATADSARLAVGTSDGAVHVFGIADGQQVLSVGASVAGAAISGLNWSRDGRTLLATAGNGRVLLIRAQDGRVQQFHRLPGAAVSGRLLNDNKSFVCVSADGRLLNAGLLASWVQVADEQAVHDLAVSGNSAVVATAGADGAVKLWNVSNGAPVRALRGHQGPVRVVAFRSDSQQLASGGADKTLRLWNAGNGQEQLRIGLAGEPLAAAYSPDRSKLVVAAGDRLYAFDPTPPNPQPAEPPGRDAAQVLAGHSGAVRGVAFAADSSTAFTASDDGSVKRWQIASAGAVATLSGHGGQVYCVAFSPDGGKLVSGSSDKTLRLWDVSAKKAVRTLATFDGSVYAACFTGDGKAVVAAGSDKTIRELDAENGSERRRYEGAEHPVYTLDISPDGKTLAAGGVGIGAQRPVLLWSLGNPQPRARLLGHDDDVYRVAFDKAGRLLSLGYSGTLLLWRPSESKPFFSRDLPVVTYAAAWSVDGRRVAVAANDGVVYLLDVPGP